VFDLISLFFYVVLVAVTIVPSWRILRRAGLSPSWSLFSLFPLGTIPVSWIIAYRRWPKGNRDATQRPPQLVASFLLRQQS
jgi:hypothetical protein